MQKYILRAIAFTVQIHELSIQENRNSIHLHLEEVKCIHLLLISHSNVSLTMYSGFVTSIRIKMQQECVHLPLRIKQIL